MSAQDDVRDDRKPDSFVRWLAGRHSALATVFRRKHSRYLPQGLRLAWMGTTWLAVATGLDTETLSTVVAFGGGETIDDALANLERSVKRDHWRPDKYGKPFLPA